MADERKAAFEIHQRDGRRFVRRKREGFAVIDKDTIGRPEPRHAVRQASLIGTEAEEEPERPNVRRQTVLCALTAMATLALAAAFVTWKVTERARPVSGVEANGVQTALLQDTTPADQSFSLNVGDIAVDKSGRTFFHVTLTNDSDQARDVTMTLSATLEGTDEKGGNWTSEVTAVRADAAAPNVAWHEDRIHVIDVDPHTSRGFDLYPSLENVDVGKAKPTRISKVDLRLDQSAPSGPQRRRVAAKDLTYRQYISEDGKNVMVSGEFLNDTGQPLDKARIAVWFIDTGLGISGTTEPLGKDAPKGLRIGYVELGHVMSGQLVPFEGKFAIGDTKAAQAHVIALVA